MKKSAALLLLSLSCLATGWAKPIAEFEADSIYVGRFTDETDEPEATFSFCSKGDTELDFRRIVASCGVSILHFLNAETETDLAGALSVRVQLNDLPNGRFYKHIYLYGNTRTKRLVVYGEVEFPVKVILPALGP